MNPDPNPDPKPNPTITNTHSIEHVPTTPNTFRLYSENYKISDIVLCVYVNYTSNILYVS